MSTTDTELRQLVRSLIREIAATLPGIKLDSVPVSRTAVRIASDDDLNAFAQQVLALAADPARAEALRSGATRFTLAGVAGAASQGPEPGSAPSQQAFAGKIVTEKYLEKLDTATRRLTVGLNAIVTPLARDRARELGITIERKG